MAKLTERLAEVIRRNTMADIASKVEEQQTALDKMANQFQKLRLQIQEQEKALKPKSSLADDKLINNATVQNQDVLRQDIQAAEKEYIDAKYNCHYFMSHLYKA